VANPNVLIPVLTQGLIRGTVAVVVAFKPVASSMAVLVVEDTMRTVKVLVVVAGEENSVPRQGSSAPSKSQANVFTTPNARSAGKGRQSAAGEVLGGLDPTQENPEQFSTQETSPDDKHWSDPDEPNFVDDVEMPHPDDIEDPWKPLNPHEPGNLKIRPYRRGTGSCCLWIPLLFSAL